MKSFFSQVLVGMLIDGLRIAAVVVFVSYAFAVLGLRVTFGQ